MAKSGLKHIDVGAELTKTEWESEDSHELLHGTSFPASPVERQLFYRDDEHKWYIYTGSAWTELTGAGSGMSVHGNEYHDPDFEQQGVAATLVGLHSTLDTHTLDQPAAEHGNEKHNPDFADASHTHSDLTPAHKDIATGLHGVGGSTVESASGAQAKVDAHKDLATGVHGAGASTLETIAGSQAKVDTHKVVTTGIHGVGGSTVESVSGSQAKVDAHKDLATGVHGVGAGTIAKVGDIAVDANLSAAAQDAINKRHSKVITLTFVIDGGGSAITTGQKGHLEIPFACTITGWTLLADQSGSIVVDVWKDTYANFPPTVADTIAGTEKPTLSSVQKNQDLTLTTWTTALTAGDILAFNVDSVTTVTRVTLSIRADKS
jgi:hypothetical protein